MKKIEIYDKVIVYKDIFTEEEVDLIYSTIKETEQDTSLLSAAMPEDSSYFDYHGPDPVERDDGTLIKTWSTWYNYGKKTFFSNNLDKELSIDGLRQAKVRQLILDKIKIAHDDYFSCYDKNSWPEYAGRNFSISNDINGMVFADIEVLQHRVNNDSEFTIEIHTDWHEQRWEWPGPKQIVTYTFYLNDDYEGGEVDFLLEEEGRMITYKPKKGDITAFPSGRPYWHSARAAHSGNNKLFIRVFALKQYSGSESWHKGASMHGVENWLKLENEKVLNFVDHGETSRQVIFIGESEPDPNRFSPPLFIDRSKSVYINGKEIN